MRRSICSVRASWRRSSPALKMTGTKEGVGTMSRTLNTSHSGAVNESFVLHLSITTSCTSTLGLEGSLNLVGMPRQRRLVRRTWVRLAAGVFCMRRASSWMRRVAASCLTSSLLWSPAQRRYTSARRTYLSEICSTCSSAWRCQKNAWPTSWRLPSARWRRNRASAESWYGSYLSTCTSCSMIAASSSWFSCARQFTPNRRTCASANLASSSSRPS
mmetsp:Transcript_10575/g.43143  ORF Transcript_10575/g.43143 Transcript_10575/m.43143 type:complete len:216 (+) Transcript_10575:308-955(+)